MSTSNSISRAAPDFAANPAHTLLRMAELFQPLGDEEVDLAWAPGRVLAQPVAADRDHPACDVSAVDGYAVRLSQLAVSRHPVVSEIRIGQASPDMQAQGVLKIVTGAPVPPGVEAIIRREEVEEHTDHIILRAGMTLKPGQDIRRRGDNIRASDLVVEAGSIISPAVCGALATFGIACPRVRRRLRLGIIVSGDELLPVNSVPQPWQLRDSHSWALPAMFGSAPWIDLQPVVTVRDDLASVIAVLCERLDPCDAVILTGGVSMGDRDYVPAALAQIGAKVVFHGLPIRPGKPMLGAVGPRGQAIFGLPGNPLSVLVTARRFATIVLRKMAGISRIDPPVPLAQLAQNVPHPPSPGMGVVVDPRFWVYRPVTLQPGGAAVILPVKSSGDLITAARADGFIEIPPGGGVPSHVGFFSWRLE